MSGEEQPLAAAGDGGQQAAAAPRSSAARSKDDVRSLAVFQILLYLNQYWVALFFIAQLLLFVWKGENLPYASGILAADVVLLFAVCFLDAVRIALSMHGNLSENKVSLVLGIALTIPPAIGVLYLLLFQTYTLRAELITCIVSLVFHLLQIVLSIAALISV